MQDYNVGMEGLGGQRIVSLLVKLDPHHLDPFTRFTSGFSRKLLMMQWRSWQRVRLWLWRSWDRNPVVSCNISFCFLRLVCFTVVVEAICKYIYLSGQ